MKTHPMLRERINVKASVQKVVLGAVVVAMASGLSLGLAPCADPDLQAHAASPAKVSSVKASSVKTSSAKITWKKSSSTKVRGYHVAVSSSSTFASSKTKTYTVKGRTSTSKTVTSLKSANRYYVKVRSYTASAKSSWSKAIAFRTKAPSVSGWWVTNSSINTCHYFYGSYARIYNSSVYQWRTGTFAPKSNSSYETYRVTAKRLSYLPLVGGGKMAAGVLYYYDGDPQYYRCDNNSKVLNSVWKERSGRYGYSGSSSLVRKK